MAPTSHKQEAKEDRLGNKYLQVPVDDVMLVDVVNTLQNLMDTVAKKSSTRNISAGIDNLIKDNLCEQ